MQEDPFVVSTNTGSKLSAFRYANSHKPAMSIPVKDKDSAVSKEPDVSHDKVAEGTLNTENEDLQTHNPVPKNCPQTPAHRIPLADLISNTEDALNMVSGKALTPDDHVYWDHRSSDTKGASPVPRRRKRPRSSSPASSPLNPGSKDLPSNFEAPRKVMKTPQHDVAADLWTKYIGKSNGNTGENVPKIHFSQHASSSPQTPAPVGRISRDPTGLRRTNSCFVDWPTSNSKRRRLDDENQVKRIRDGFARSKSSILRPGKSKASKIGMLVEKIQESLMKRSKEDRGPSSSSPLPERAEYIHDYPATPPKDMEAEHRLETPSKSPTKGSKPDQPVELDVTEDFSELLASDFGDDDLDNDFLELAVETPDKGQNEQQEAEAELTIDIGDFSDDKEVVVDRQYQTSQIPPRNDGNDDDFDDGDDDFPDGMEEILAQYDDFEASPAGQGNTPEEMQTERRNKVPGIANGHMKTGQGKVHFLDGVDGDEFDDDGIDLAAIEQTMLQDSPSATMPPSQVRRPLCL